MSADPCQTALEALQCHFTWDLDPTRSVLFRLRDKLEDIRSEEGTRWLGPILNLWGFIQSKLGRHEDALSLFLEAAEAFHRLRHADQGPWLVVNYGDLAWLHHHLGDQEQSQAYLSKVDALMKEYPASPQGGGLHAEVYAEKAWTLMKFGEERQTEAAECFEKAVSLQPDMVEWNTSHVLSLVREQERSGTGVTPDLLERMRQAKVQDPENLYLAVLYLEQRAKTGERVGDEVREFARRNLEPLSRSYQAFRALLTLYKNQRSVDEAIALAEEVLGNHPDQRFLMKCAALCYRWRIVAQQRNSPGPSPDLINRAVILHEDVVRRYPPYHIMLKINLASLCAKSRPHHHQAALIFRELFQADLEPVDKQLLYNAHARYLFHDKNNSPDSIRYHMKAVEIPVRSSFRDHSLTVLETVRTTHRVVREFLENLKEPV